MDSNDDDLLIYNQRSSLLSSSIANVHRKGARRRLAVVFIEIFKLLSIPAINGGRFDPQRYSRICHFPANVAQLTHVNFKLIKISILKLSLTKYFSMNLKYKD